MGKHFFFGKLIKSSLSHRKSRVLVAIIAVVLGVSLASALLDISFDIGERTGSTLRGYGANILLVPKEATLQVGLGELSFGTISGEGFIVENDLARIESLESAKYLVSYAPFLYSIVDINGQKVVLSGVWFDSLMSVNPSWKLTGNGIQNREDNRSAVVGANAAEKLGLRLGDEFEISYEGRIYSFSLLGTLSTGGSEDNQVFVNLNVAQKLSQKEGRVHIVQLSYLAGKVNLDSVAEDLTRSISSANAKILSQVAESEESFLRKIQAVMSVLTIGVLAASAFAVTSTISTSILERRNEIGLMLALGADSKRISQLFLTEAVITGLIGGLLGYLLGVGLASLVWLQVFNVPILPRPITIPAAVVIAIGVTFIASMLPVRQALRINPTVTLKGE